jgi:hypothetical protein
MSEASPTLKEIIAALESLSPTDATGWHLVAEAAKRLKRIEPAVEILRSMNLAPRSSSAFLKLIEQRVQVLILLEGES